MCIFKIKVVIADDHPAVLIGMKHVLATKRTLDIVGSATDSTQLMSILDQHSCDVLVTDYVMPGGKFGDGTPLLALIKRRYPKLKVVVFTMLDNPATTRNLIQHGISCILSKADPTEHIVCAILAAYADKSYFSPLIDEIVQRLGINQDTNDSLPALSKREAEVIRLYALGYTISQIAEQLHRSKQTISSQKQRAMQKLGIQREPDLFKYAMEIGII
ncbi:response regulator [Pseudomonas putida]|uniref:response regulator n=1 Tax=Pseudomonas putida TaxID=303 RepID=UPI003D98D16C